MGHVFPQFGKWGMMRFIPPPLSSLSHSAARWLSAAAVLALAIGGLAATAGPSAAATSLASGSAASTTLQWHKLALINGWTSASEPGLNAGTPSWAVSNGVVYLRGAVNQPTDGDNEVFADLPAAAWPASNLYLSVYTHADEAGGVVFVGTGGTLEAYDGYSHTFTSLAGISYPATTMKSHDLTLQNGWVSSQSEYGTGNPAYEVSKGVVYLSGSLNGGTKPLAGVLPAGAAPAHELLIEIYTNGGSTGWLEILPNGEVEVFGANAGSYASLAGVSFPAASATWHPFALKNGWTSGQAKFHTAAPAWTVINGVVYLTGSMYQAKGTDGAWTTLPAGVRTGGDVLELQPYTSGGVPGVLTATASVASAGSAPYKAAQAETSLAGLAYPQGS